MSPSRDAMSGVLFVVLAVACFGTLDTSTKFAAASVPVFMALWLRYLFQTAVTVAVTLPRRGITILRTAHPEFQVLRGVLLLTTSSLAYFSLQHMPVGEFTAIVMVTPLAITVMAATVLKEQVSLMRWVLVAGGFAGVLLILRPGTGVFGWASLLPIGLVICNACFQVLTSRLARTDDPVTIHLHTSWTGLLITTVVVPFVWVRIDSTLVWFALALMAAMGALGHFLLILAYQRAPASSLTPFLYAQIAFAMIGGWIVFDHLPDRWSIAGIALVGSCGAAGAWLTARESRVSIVPTET